MSAPTAAAAAAAAASRAKSTHLLRALLRETTYLPDPVARQYLRRHVVGRFRAYHPKDNVKQRPLSTIHTRTPQQQHQASKALNCLRRANQGSLPCLQRVLYLAYGRVGRRKHALLETLLRPEPPVEVDAASPPDPHPPSPLQTHYYSNRHWLQFFDRPKEASNSRLTIPISNRYPRLQAVIRSQHRQGLSLGRALKGSAMVTDKYNVWMRTMPIKRAVHNVRRWYAEAMTRLLPPLPSDEWDNMRAMALRKKPVRIIRRRKPGISLTPGPPASQTAPHDDILENLKMSKRSRADKTTDPNRPSTLTPDSLRRLYARVLLLCCKLEYDYERQQWKVHWGEPVPSGSARNYKHATAHQTLFEGVDASGKLLRTAKSTSAPPPRIQPRNAHGEYVRFPFYTEFLPADNPLQKELAAWKAKRAAAGMPLDDSVYRGR